MDTSLGMMNGCIEVETATFSRLCTASSRLGACLDRSLSAYAAVYISLHAMVLPITSALTPTRTSYDLSACNTDSLGS